MLLRLFEPTVIFRLHCRLHNEVVALCLYRLHPDAIGGEIFLDSPNPDVSTNANNVQSATANGNAKLSHGMYYHYIDKSGNQYHTNVVFLRRNSFAWRRC